MSSFLNQITAICCSPTKSGGRAIKPLSGALANFEIQAPSDGLLFSVALERLPRIGWGLEFEENDDMSDDQGLLITGLGHGGFIEQYNAAQSSHKIEPGDFIEQVNAEKESTAAMKQMIEEQSQMTLVVRKPWRIVVKLDKPKGASEPNWLGLDMAGYKWGLRVTQVSKGALVLHNLKNPDEKVDVGDWIEEANGVNESGEIRKCLLWDPEVSMIVRKSPKYWFSADVGKPPAQEVAPPPTETVAATPEQPPSFTFAVPPAMPQDSIRTVPGTGLSALEGRGGSIRSLPGTQKSSYSVATSSTDCPPSPTPSPILRDGVTKWAKVITSVSEGYTTRSVLPQAPSMYFPQSPSMYIEPNPVDQMPAMYPQRTALFGSPYANGYVMAAGTTPVASTASIVKTVCVCGGGNATHVFIPYFSQNGYSVTVFADFGDEAERLQKGIDENDGILVHDRCNPKDIREYKGRPSVISKDAKDVVPQADYIIIALPSFAIKNVLTGIKPYLKQGAIIYIMPGQGGPDYVARQVLGDQLKAGKCTMAGIIPMPLNCRISDYGKRVELAALKASYDLATVPARNAEKAAEGLRGLLPGKKVNIIGNYVGIALHASNPNLHPGRLYGLFGPDSQLGPYHEGMVYPENPLFYETWTDLSSYWCQKISDERCKIWDTICQKVPGTGVPEQVPDLHSYLSAIYAGQILDNSSITGCTSTNDGFKGFRCPMKEVQGGFVPDFANRYFTEDFPEGVAMYKGIADLAGVETPVMDEILTFFQKFMGKEYIKGGKLAGADVAETKSPQAFGIKTLQELLAD